MTETTKALLEELDLKEINNARSVNQNGNYLLFKGAKGRGVLEETLEFQIIIAGNTLVSSKNSLLPMLEDVRKKAMDFGNARGQNIYVSTNLVNADAQLVYAINLEITKTFKG